MTPSTKPKARSPWGAAVSAVPSLPLSVPPRVARTRGHD